MMKDNASIKLLAVFIATVIVVSAVPSAICEIETENLYPSSISVPSTIKVLMLNGSVISMNLDEYLKGVVSAEMYPNWPIEALKAQAVASRSFAIANTHHDHVSVDVCTDPGCCQAWKAGPYSENATKAVTDTHSVVITYSGEIAGEALFFAHCNGHTRNSEDYDAWGYVPYLRSVPCDCGYDEYNGHGVGMCQWGAKAMAEQGYSYLDILKHYYTGIEVEGVSPTPSQIIVEDADTIWNTTTTYSSHLTDITSNVTPRIMAEYANSIYHSHLNLSTDLTTVTSNVTPRILTEYANSIYRNDLGEIPTELANLTKEVPPKIIIEYATSTWSTSLSPPPFIKPEVSVSTDKTEYAPGDTMTVTIAFRNPGGYAVNTYFLWYFGLPDYDYWIPVMQTPFTLPPDYNQSFNVSMPIGTWSDYSFNASWYVALYNTTTSEVVFEDTADWRYVVPSKIAKGEGIMPEEIAKEVESKTHLEKAFTEHFLLEKEPAKKNFAG